MNTRAAVGAGAVGVAGLLFWVMTTGEPVEATRRGVEGILVVGTLVGALVVYNLYSRP